MGGVVRTGVGGVVVKGGVVVVGWGGGWGGRTIIRGVVVKGGVVVLGGGMLVKGTINKSKAKRVLAKR